MKREDIQRLLFAMFLCIIAEVICGAVTGFIEPIFFTVWMVSNFGWWLHRIVMLNHFTNLCLLLLGISFIVPLYHVARAYYDGNKKLAVAYAFAGAIGIPLWIMTEDFVAGIRYGGLPKDHWTHWMWESHFMLWENFWLPTWYFFAVGFACLVFFGFVMYKVYDTAKNRKKNVAN